MTAEEQKVERRQITLTIAGDCKRCEGSPGVRQTGALRVLCDCVKSSDGGGLAAEDVMGQVEGLIESAVNARLDALDVVYSARIDELTAALSPAVVEEPQGGTEGAEAPAADAETTKSPADAATGETLGAGAVPETTPGNDPL